MFIVALLLTGWLVMTQQWAWPDQASLKILIISGFVGIFLGDTLLFTSVKVLGPRMAGLLFATNAPLTFLFGLWLFGENHNAINLIGVVAVTVGVFVAISARSKAGEHHWEQSAGHVGFGLLAGFGAALCQSLGAILIVKLLRNGQDPVFATMLRVWVAVFFLFLSLFVTKFSGGFSSYAKLNKKMLVQLTASGLFGMAIGMSFYLTSISLAPIGIATILSATTPVIVLPLLWITTRERPSVVSLFAASVVVTGTAFIFLAG
jgi:drug/metabolite transporter (DMT)-like permease